MLTRNLLLKQRAKEEHQIKSTYDISFMSIRQIDFV